jgi:mannan endo-1,4-beta-mannosidase
VSTSDVYDLTGTNPAILGIDSLSLIGMENAWRMPSAEPAVDDVTDPKNIPAFIEGTALRSIEAWKNGTITTLSLHMSDPGMVYDHYRKDNRNIATGRPIYTGGGRYKWNFYGYGYDNSTRTPIDERDNRERSPYRPMLRMYRAITGKSTDPGDTGVVEVFNAYLDIVADYCLILQDRDIPVLMRPFHENSGDWFWWGNSGCENEDGSYNPGIFKRIWRYTVEYLMGRGVHNCIYVYSPNGADFDNEAKLGTPEFRPYAITYPGDDWVDICAFDDYTIKEEVMVSDIDYVTGFAAEHGKIAAASEVTGSPVDPAITEYLVRTLTNTSHLPLNLSYFLQWTPPSFAPYLVSPTRANSGAANAFIRALNNPRIITADRTCGFKTI